MLLWARGLEEFITRVENPRLELEQRAGLDPKRQFERVLPYAMALGVATRWAQAFRDIYTTAPQWYVGPMGPNFSSLYLLQGLNHMGAAPFMGRSGSGIACCVMPQILVMQMEAPVGREVAT